MSSLLRQAAACALLVAASAVHADPAPAGAEPTGIAAFSSHARFVDARISPGGTYLAAVSVEGGKRTLTFIDLRTRRVASTLTPGPDDMVGDFAWASDDRVVADIVSQDGVLARPRPRGELFGVNADGSDGRLLYGYRVEAGQTGSHVRRAEREQGSATILDPLVRDPRHVIISTVSWQPTDDRKASIYKLDVVTGLKTPITQAPIPEAHVLTDETGEPRIAAGEDADQRARFFFRDPELGWRELQGIGGGAPVGYVSRDRTLYVDAPAQGAFGLWAVNVDTGARRLLSRNDKVPWHRLVTDAVSHRIVAVEYEPDLPVYDLVEPDHPLCRLLRGLQAAYPGQRIEIVSRTADDGEAVVYVRSDRDPGQFLLANVRMLSVDPLVDVRPWIKPEAMAGTSAFHIAASDGLRIHGYLTRPPGLAAGATPPLVVLPHGGPHQVRDYWGFDPEVQLLAAHGFAVLQVNYRGSSGYGRRYMEAGYRHWGDRVSQDIVDATRWAVAKGYADSKRVCSYGGSFGGYAALQVAILAPDLFRCAVGFAGPYDLARQYDLADTPETRRGRGYLHAALGDDAAALAAASPAKNAAKLRARVLLIHGQQDRRVPIAHAEEMRAALIAAGNPPEWLVEPAEGHGFYDDAARQRMYARILAFLEANTQAAPAAATAAKP